MGCTSSAPVETTIATSKQGVYDYEKVKVLGVGASCEVIVGRKKANDKLYAVKILKRDRNDSNSDNEYLFKNEVEIMKTSTIPTLCSLSNASKIPTTSSSSPCSVWEVSSLTV